MSEIKKENYSEGFEKDATGKIVMKARNEVEGFKIENPLPVPEQRIDKEQIRDISNITLPEEILKLKTNKKVAIVGFAPSWNLAPFDNKEFDVWGINELYMLAVGKRFTHWFEIHDPWSPSRNIKSHHEWLKNSKIPVFMQRHFEEFPPSIAYPREVVKNYVNQNFVIETVGSYFTDFSNQIAWMYALAIMMEYEEIHVYGVDMAQKSEYAWQKPACQFFIGFAAGKGCKVLVPKNSELCKYPRDYGWDTDNYQRNLKKQRIKEVGNRIAQIDNQIFEQDYYIKVFEDDIKAYEKQVKKELEALIIDRNILQSKIEKDKEIIGFLESMPPDINTIFSKRDSLIKKCIDNSNNMQQNIAKCDEKIKNLTVDLDQKRKQTFIQLEILKANKENSKLSKFAHQGCVDECKYDLSNNLV